MAVVVVDFQRYSLQANVLRYCIRVCLATLSHSCVDYRASGPLQPHSPPTSASSLDPRGVSFSSRFFTVCSYFCPIALTKESLFHPYSFWEAGSTHGRSVCHPNLIISTICLFFVLLSHTTIFRPADCPQEELVPADSIRSVLPILASLSLDTPLVAGRLQSR